MERYSVDRNRLFCCALLLGLFIDLIGFLNIDVTHDAAWIALNDCKGRYICRDDGACTNHGVSAYFDSGKDGTVGTDRSSFSGYGSGYLCLVIFAAGEFIV